MSDNPSAAISRPATELINSAKPMLTDLDTDAALIDDPVWKSSLQLALGDLSRWKPLLKRVDVEFVAGEDTVTLPADFIAFDLDHFNKALLPLGIKVTVNAAYFAFEWLSAAAGDLSFGYGCGPFAKGTTFQIIDSADSDGTKQMWLEPAPRSARTIKTLYKAAHVVSDPVIGDEDVIITEGKNSVPATLRDVLLMRVCYHALIALAGLVAGDDKLCTRVMEVAEKFNAQYEKRVAFAPYGRRA